VKSLNVHFLNTKLENVDEITSISYLNYIDDEISIGKGRERT
jgi:hypothetical protein